METQKLPTLQIPQDVIQPIIEAHVRDAVLRAFDGYKPAVDALISSILNVKVNEHGKPFGDRQYGSERAPKWIDWALGEALRDAVKKVIVEKVTTLQASLEKHIAAELEKKNSPLAKQVAESLLKGFSEIAVNNYRLKVEAVMSERL